MTQLSEHFSLEELTTTGRHPSVDNTPTQEIVDNLTNKLAPKLEEFRAIVGQPVVISYGYRGPSLNRLVGGSVTSAHMFGLAADTVCPGKAPQEVFDMVKADPTFMLDVDQLIIERGCVHVGLLVPGTHDQARRELRTDANDPNTGGRIYPLLGIWEPPSGVQDAG